jgi:hypothetical protein
VQRVGWAKQPDANAFGGVPTIETLHVIEDGGHGAKIAPLPTLLLSSLRGALATKQSSLSHGKTGLLRFARNDGEYSPFHPHALNRACSA